MIRKMRRRRHDNDDDDDEEGLPTTVRFNVVVSVFLLAAFLARLLLSLTPAPLALPWKRSFYYKLQDFWKHSHLSQNERHKTDCMAGLPPSRNLDSNQSIQSSEKL